MLLTLIFITSAFACSPGIRNETRPAGYARAEDIMLRFSMDKSSTPLDSLRVCVIEEKSGFKYDVWAIRTDCMKRCHYLLNWNGGKPDGSWPLGGRYKIFAFIEQPKYVQSDTVEIGLTD